MPVLTIMIPVYNHFAYLDQCFQSIISQNDKTAEIVCVDDNSTDERVLEYLDRQKELHNNIIVKKNDENVGISTVLNQGLALSSGEFIGFVDCDDYLPPGAILTILQHIKKFPDVDYFFSDRNDVDENNKVLHRTIYGGYPNIKPGGDIKNDLLDGMVASHLKVIRKSIIEKIGGFDPGLNGVQDWDMALKVAEKGNLHYIPEVLYNHRIHTQSVTQSDKVSQFRKTNIVRRRTCDRWFKKQISPEVAVADLKHYLINVNEVINSKFQQMNVVLFSPWKQSLQEIKLQTELGKVCVFDARVKFQLTWVNFLREFNSYFDLIIIDDPAVAVAIMGYVWNPKIIWLLDA